MGLNMVERALIEQGLKNDDPDVRQYWFEQPDVALSNSDVFLGLSDPDEGVRTAAHMYKMSHQMSYNDILKGQPLSPGQEAFLVTGFLNLNWSTSDLNKWGANADSVFEDFNRTFLTLNFTAAASNFDRSILFNKIFNAIKVINENKIDENVPYFKETLVKMTPSEHHFLMPCLDYVDGHNIDIVAEILSANIPAIDRMRNLNNILALAGRSDDGRLSFQIYPKINPQMAEKDYHALIEEVLSDDQPDHCASVLKNFINSEFCQNFGVPSLLIDKLVVHPSGNFRCLVAQENLWRTSTPTKNQMKELLEKEPSVEVHLAALKMKSWGDYRPSVEFSSQCVLNAQDSVSREHWFDRKEASFSDEAFDFGLMSTDACEREAAVSHPGLVINLERLALLYNDPSERVRSELYIKTWPTSVESSKDDYMKRELNLSFPLFRPKEITQTFQKIFGVSLDTLNLPEPWVKRIELNQAMLGKDNHLREHCDWSRKGLNFKFSKEMVNAVGSRLFSAKEATHLDFSAMVHLVNYAGMVNQSLANRFVDKFLPAAIEENRIYQGDSDGVHPWGMSELVSRMVPYTSELSKEKILLVFESKVGVEDFWQQAKPFMDEDLYVSAFNVWGRPDWGHYDPEDFLSNPEVQNRLFTALDDCFDVSKGEKSMLIASEKVKEKALETINYIHHYGSFHLPEEEQKKYPNLLRFLGNQESPESALSHFESEVLKSKTSIKLPEVRQGATGWSAL